MASVAHRLLFPEDRTAFIYGKPGEPILTPFRTGLQIFTEEECLHQADILTLHGEDIPHSTIYTGDDTLLPLFYGPVDYVSLLWAKVVGGVETEAYPLTAQYSEQLLLVPTLLHGHGPPPPELGVAGSSYIDELNHILYGPKTTVWPSTGFALQGPQGDPGGYFEHPQISPSALWVIDHNLTFRPNVTVLDSAGHEVIGDISYPQPNRVVIEFSSQLGGTALLS